MAQAAVRARQRGVVRLGALAAGVVVVAATSVAFLDTSGVTSTSITAASSAGVSIDLAGATPLSGTASAGNPTTWVTGGATAVTSGMWSPQLDTPVSVVAAGDVAIVNASSLSASSNVIIDLSVTNTPALNAAYSYFNLPVNLYSWTYAAGSGSWGLATPTGGSILSSTSPTILSLTESTASWEVPGGGVYEIEIPFDAADTNGDNGSFYMFQATGTAGATWSLAPDFYVSTQTVG